MLKIKYIVLYFNNKKMFPNNFSLWLESCGFNDSIEWLIFTDCDTDRYKIPSNVTIEKTSFEDIKKLIQSKFDFTVSIERAYKLCDFRPAFGYIFEDWLKDADYWGFCDIDLVWGNIRKFMPDKILEQNERIGSEGHSSVFKNNEFNRYAFRKLDKKGCQDYIEVFSSQKHYCFDEWAGHDGGGMSMIYKKNNIKMASELEYVDVSPNYNRFVLDMKDAKAQNSIYVIKDKSAYVLYENEGELVQKEVMCIHFQKRRFKNLDEIKNFESILIHPYDANVVECDKEPDLKYFKRVTKSARIFDILRINLNTGIFSKYRK